MLKISGIMMGGESAVEYLEMLPDNIPEEIRDDDFCEEYERMLNRVRYEVRKAVPVAPFVTKAKVKVYGDFYTCGQCGFGVRPDIYKYCPNCGRAISWKAIFPERTT
jgi:rubrerythrin